MYVCMYAARVCCTSYMHSMIVQTEEEEELDAAVLLSPRVVMQQERTAACISLVCGWNEPTLVHTRARSHSVPSTTMMIEEGTIQLCAIVERENDERDHHFLPCVDRSSTAGEHSVSHTILAFLCIYTEAGSSFFVRHTQRPTRRQQ